VRVEVQLFATLAAFLPLDSCQGTATLDIPERSTLRDVIQRLGLPADLERVTLVNGGDAAPDQPLRAGDVVAVFPPLAGGRDESRPSAWPGCAIRMVHSSGRNGARRRTGSV
jgi:sulfur-carrier protein